MRIDSVVSRSQTTPEPSRIVDRDVARCTGTCGEVGLQGAAERLARAVRGRRLGVHEQQDVERDPELRRQRVQRVDRRLGAAGLDLGDQARRHAHDLGQAAAGSGRAPGAPGAAGRPWSAYSGSVAPLRRSTPTRSPSLRCWPSMLPVECCRRVAPAPSLCSISERRNRAGATPSLQGRIRMRTFASPGAMTVDWEERVNPDRLRVVPLRPRQGRARRLRPRLDAAVRLQQHPLRHQHPHRRVGARQDDALRAPDARRQPAHLGLRVGGQAPPAELPVARPGEHPRRDGRPARRRGARTPACSGGPPARSARS